MSVWRHCQLQVCLASSCIQVDAAGCCGVLACSCVTAARGRRAAGLCHQLTSGQTSFSDSGDGHHSSAGT